MVDTAADTAAVRQIDLDHDRKTVIGVDDARENLMLEKAYIEAAGFRFVGVATGAECMALVVRIKPKLILLDIQMPDVDGFETCKLIRAIPEGQKVPIAFVTARKTEADVRAGLAAGGNDFIIKPFNRARLIDRVHYWTARSVPAALDKTG